MMRKVLAFAALGLVLSVAAGAQGRRGGGFGGQRGMFGGGLQLLTIKEVQTELKMTEPQVSKIQEKQQAISEKRREIFQNAQGGGNREEMMAAMQKLNEEQDKAVADILDSTQLKRYKQLELQRAGAGALNRKDVQESLKITEAQKTQIQEIQQKAGEEMRAMFQGGGNPQDLTPEERQARMKKFQDAQKATNDKVLAVLTDTQRNQFKQMQGEPFKFPPMQFGPGGRAGGGRPAAPPVG